MEHDTLEQELHSLDMIDFSNYDVNHPLYSNEHARKPGKWKDEQGGKKKIQAVVALRSKVYAMKLEDAGDVLKAKGVPGSGLNKLTFEHYKSALMHQRIVAAQFNIIRHKNFHLSIASVKKTALASFCDKRGAFCTIHTFPYGSVEQQMYPDICPMCHFTYEQREERLREFLINHRPFEH